MPNWVETQIRIRGKQETIDKLAETVKSDDNVFDFEKIIPMPEELNIVDGSYGEKGMRYILLMADQHLFTGNDEKFINEMEELKKNDPDTFNKCIDLGKQYLSNIAKYGYATWYNWCRINWGTKWNSSDSEYDGCGCYMFRTAWSFCYPVIEKLSSMFPELEIEFWYADEDCGYNTGHGIFKGGELVLEDFPDNDSNHAYEIYLITHPEHADELVLGDDGVYRWVDEE